MIDRIISAIAPHICCSCGRDFGIGCENCISDIIEEPYAQCIGCLRPAAADNLCTQCRLVLPVRGAWAVGERHEGLERLIDAYKFDRAREAASILARLLDARLPQLPPDTLITYIPDIPAHRRQRGYDHMKYLAKLFANRRRLALEPLLERRTNVSQRTLSKQQRLRAQQDAFAAVHRSCPVVLIDDIYTTGATIRAGVAALTAAGNTEIYVAIVARQPFVPVGSGKTS